MLRYVETYYRHRLLLTGPIAVVLLIVVGWLLVQPPSYDSTVRLWAEKQTVVPNVNDNPYLTPAQTESAALTELLATKYFCVKVGNRSQLAQNLSGPTRPGLTQSLLSQVGLANASPRTPSQQEVDDRVFAVLSSNTTVLAAGPQMVTVTFRTGTPELAAVVAQAIADQFIDESLTSQRVQVEAAVEFYAAQVKQAEGQLADADSKVDTYLAAHPEQRSQTAVPDATLTQLRRNDDGLRSRYQDLVSKRDQAEQNRTALTQVGLSGIRVLDKAIPPTSASSLRKLAIEAAAVGLGLSVAILVAGILLLTLIDSTVRRPEEVEQVLDLRFVGTVPRLRDTWLSRR
jgi:uncharacterized protein involved in exopolysaccharide biosynthesis